jgi:hypothetical protein
LTSSLAEHVQRYGDLDQEQRNGQVARGDVG